jgi:hypothetical protein
LILSMYMHDRLYDQDYSFLFHCKPNPCLEVATDYDLYKKNIDIDVYTDFENLKSKYFIIFLGTMGFSLHRDGRYVQIRIDKYQVSLRVLQLCRVCQL